MSWWPDLPGEMWALAGVILTGLLAYIREKMKTQSSPYAAMAKRLEKVEEKADVLPELNARFSILATWASEANDWMVEIYEAYKDDTGVRYFPPPPTPPPHWDRRIIDIGPPVGDTERREDGAQ